MNKPKVDPFCRYCMPIEQDDLKRLEGVSTFRMCTGHREMMNKHLAQTLSAAFRGRGN